LNQNFRQNSQLNADSNSIKTISILLIFFASSDVNRTSVKVSLHQQDLPLQITLLLTARE